MNSDKESRIINSIMGGLTIVVFIACLIIFEEHFSNNFFQNLFMVILMLIGSFFIGNIAIGIPIGLIYYVTTYTFEDFYEIPRHKRYVIIGILLIIICIVLAILMTL